MATRDLCFTPAVELSRLYRTGRASPLEVMQAVLARIDAVNPDVNAIVTLVREDALLTYAFSVLGLPAISIPCGFTKQGLPVGLLIVGRRRAEAAVLRAAAAFEAARPWADRVPPIVERIR